MADMSNELERSKQLLDSAPKVNVQQESTLDEFVLELIKSNICSTISIKYELSVVYVIFKLEDNRVKTIRFNTSCEEDYLNFCKNVLGIDINEHYNCSRTKEIRGVSTRIFAIMPPFSRTPLITISTTKMPPESIPDIGYSDEVLADIVHSNFLIVGGSGSGKTYLMNYLLHRFIGNSELVELIEEFGELVPPNDITMRIIVPPTKPGEESLLHFVTEQSNLQRLDAIYVGEIKGKEAWPFVMNLASGTRGGATMHGDDAEKALSRLRALCLPYCKNEESINQFISKSLKYIIVMEKHRINVIKKLNGVAVKGNFSMEELRPQQ
jgi:hypothetical protein